MANPAFSWLNYQGNAFPNSGTSTNVGSSQANGSNGAFTAGNVLIAQVVVYTSSETITPPAGWTLIAPTIQDTDNGDTVGWYVHVCDGTETGSFTFSWSASSFSTWVLACYTGVDNISPIDGAIAQHWSSSSTSQAIGPITNAKSSDTAVLIAYCDNNPISLPADFTAEPGSGGVQASGTMNFIIGHDNLSSSGTFSDTFTVQAFRGGGYALFTLAASAAAALPPPDGIAQPKRLFTPAVDGPSHGLHSKRATDVLPITRVVTLTVTSSSTISTLKGASRALSSFLSPSTVSNNNQTGKIVTAASTSALSMVRKVGKVPAVLAPAAITVSKAIARALSALSSSVVTAPKRVSRGLATFTSSSVVSVTKTTAAFVMEIGRQAGFLFKPGAGPTWNLPPRAAYLPPKAPNLVNVAVFSTSTVSVGKRTSKLLTALSTSSVTVTRAVGRTVVATSASAVSALRAVGKIAAVPNFSAVTVSRAMTRALVVFSSGAVVTVKMAAKSLTASSSSVVTITWQRVRLLTVTVVSTSTVSMQNQVSKLLLAASSGAVVVSRSVRIVRSVLSPGVVALQKAMTHASTILAPSSVSALASRTFFVVVSLVSTSAVTATKQIGRQVTAASTGAVSVTKRLTKGLALASSSAVSVLASRLFNVFVSITSSSTVTTVKQMQKTLSLASLSALLIGIGGRILSTAKYALTGQSAYRLTGAPSMITHDPLDFIAGKTWQMSVKLVDAFNNPLSLAGATVTWKLDTIGGGTNLITLNTNSGIIISDLVNSVVFIDVPKGSTANVPADTYQDLVYVTTANGDDIAVLTGMVRVAGTFS